MSRGVLMVAHNNVEIDYFKIACANALMVQKNLNVPVTLITDAGTYDWGKSSLGDELINSCFEQVITVKRDYTFSNPRNFADTSSNIKLLEFYNCRHWEAYELSPYDETLFIDSDYLIMSSALNNCWGSNNDVMINYTICSTLGDGSTYYSMVDNVGITLYWATVIYFKKSSLAANLFSLVHHIEDNFQYYKSLYCFSSAMFRNDIAFSIAVHTLNGFNKETKCIHELPITGLLMSWDSADIYKINEINDITIYSEKENAPKDYILTRLKNTDIHIMNKWSINRHTDKLIELYKDSTCLAAI